MGTQTHLPPKFSFSSDFGHFILKMLIDYWGFRARQLRGQFAPNSENVGKCKICICVKEKDTEIS